MPLTNVHVALRNSIPQTDVLTDGNGFFSFGNAFRGFQAFIIAFPEGNYANYIFEPEVLFIQNNSGNNFIGRPKTASISGKVTVGGVGRSGVLVTTGNPQPLSTTTDANGNYTFNAVGEGVTMGVGAGEALPRALGPGRVGTACGRSEAGDAGAVAGGSVVVTGVGDGAAVSSGIARDPPRPR